MEAYYKSKIDEYEILLQDQTENIHRLTARRNDANARVRRLREELYRLSEPGSYVGEVVKVMSKENVLVKMQSEVSTLVA